MKSSETVWLWLFKILAGLLILVLLGVHFVVNHIVAPGGLLSYADVVHYYQVPGIVLMEAIFLAFVVSHALVGLRSILLDLHPSPLVLRVATWFLAVLGVGAVIYGVWLLLLIQSRA
jgi:succinate dehydrogenase hydrophobic anchor subunit